MIKTTPHNKIRNKLLSDPKTKKAYDDLELEFAIINIIISRHVKKGIAYKEYIKQLGLKSGSLNKLGTGEFNPTLRFLKELSSVLGVKITIKLSY